MGLTADIRSALVSALKTSVTGVTVYGSMPASIPSGTSALIVLPGKHLAEFGQSASSRPSRSVIRWGWQVLAAVPKSVSSAQGTLDGLVDSVPDAIEVDRTLGGHARSATCTGVSEVGEDDVASNACLVASFAVEVITQYRPTPPPSED